ncbi:hypothetical protein ACKVMT_13990 [Halobacteriales archaeon Cl-PHB]
MVVKTDEVASPARARRRHIDQFTNALRYYPRTVWKLAARRSWKLGFRRTVTRSGRAAALVGLHTEGPIYHTDDDRLLVLRPIDGVSAAVVADPPGDRVYYGSRSLGTTFEADFARPHLVFDLAAHDLTVAEALAQLRPVDRCEPDADSTPGPSPAVSPPEENR